MSLNQKVGLCISMIFVGLGNSRFRFTICLVTQKITNTHLSIEAVVHIDEESRVKDFLFLFLFLFLFCSVVWVILVSDFYFFPRNVLLSSFL